MNITISCAGRFHGYNLACELQNKELLNRLITTYPISEVRKFGIKQEKIKSILWWEIASRSLRRLSTWLNIGECWSQPGLNDIYDYVAAHYIHSETNIFIGWSGKSEQSMKKARKIGAATVLERGSSHIKYQTAILREEIARYSPNPRRCFTHNKVVNKELREYEMADYISVPSSFVRDTFITHGVSAEKLILNQFGVNTEQFKPGKKNDEIFRVVYAGQMSLRKGVHYLLKAFSSLNLTNSELVLVGSKTAEIIPFFEEYKGKYRYVPPVPQSRLVSIYNQASVFVICSIEEGLAMVQVQAMASGLPLICTTNTGGGDLISDGKEGFVIPIRDVTALQEKLLWCYSHQEELLRMGEKARNRVSGHHAWSDYGRRYTDNLRSRGLLPSS